MLLKLSTRGYRGDKEVGQYLCHEFEIDRDCWGQQYASAVVADPWYELSSLGHSCEVRKVIYNDPATIVFWNDGTKTVVKCMEGDTFSQETGLAMCICKKALGDDFHKTFHEWVDYG